MEKQTLIKILEDKNLVIPLLLGKYSWANDFRVGLDIKKGEQTLILHDDRWAGTGTCEEITPLVSENFGLALINRLVWVSYPCHTDYRTFQNLFLVFEPTKKVIKIAGLECTCDQYGVHNGLYPINLEESERSIAKFIYEIGSVKLKGLHFAHEFK